MKVDPASKASPGSLSVTRQGVKAIVSFLAVAAVVMPFVGWQLGSTVAGLFMSAVTVVLAGIVLLIYRLRRILEPVFTVGFGALFAVIGVYLVWALVTYSASHVVEWLKFAALITLAAIGAVWTGASTVLGRLTLTDGLVMVVLVVVYDMRGRLANIEDKLASFGARGYVGDLDDNDEEEDPR